MKKEIKKFSIFLQFTMVASIFLLISLISIKATIAKSISFKIVIPTRIEDKEESNCISDIIGLINSSGFTKKQKKIIIFRSDLKQLMEFKINDLINYEDDFFTKPSVLPGDGCNQSEIVERYKCLSEEFKMDRENITSILFSFKEINNEVYVTSLDDLKEEINKKLVNNRKRGIITIFLYYKKCLNSNDIKYKKPIVIYPKSDEDEKKVNLIYPISSGIFDFRYPFIWEKTELADGYEIQFSTIHGKDLLKIENLKSSCVLIDKTDICGRCILTFKTVYVFKIRAYFDCYKERKYSSWSDEGYIFIEHCNKTNKEVGLDNYYSCGD